MFRFEEIFYCVTLPGTYLVPGGATAAITRRGDSPSVRSRAGRDDLVALFLLAPARFSRGPAGFVRGGHAADCAQVLELPLAADLHVVLLVAGG